MLLIVHCILVGLGWILEWVRMGWVVSHLWKKCTPSLGSLRFSLNLFFIHARTLALINQIRLDETEARYRQKEAERKRRGQGQDDDEELEEGGEFEDL